MQTKVIYNNSDYILYELPPGKPDPNDPCTKETLENDTRQRVLQKGSQGWCWLAALHTISDRIGKKSIPELHQQRIHERLCSQRRKDLSAINEKIQNRFPPNSLLFALDKPYVEYLMNSLKIRMHSAEAEILREFPDFFSYADAFISQIEYEDFGSFITNYFYQNDILTKLDKFEAWLLFEHSGAGISNLEENEVLAAFPDFFSYADQFINQTNYSNFRDFITNYSSTSNIGLNNYYIDIQNQISANSIFFQLSKSYVRELSMQRNSRLAYQEILKEFPEFPSFVDAFISQTKYINFWEFISNYYQNIKSDEINKNFIDKIKQSMGNFIEQSTPNDPIFQRISQSVESTFEYLRKTDQNYNNKFTSRSWNQLTLDEHYLLTDRYVTYAIAKLYELKIASWTPFQPIEALIKDLKEKGPLVVSGTFHPAVYTMPYYPYGKVNGHDILAWPENTKDKNSSVHHGVTIIGAEKTKELVYYVDPNDPSDPAAPEKKPIYAIPYKELKEGIIGLTNIGANDEFPSPGGYAWAARSFRPINTQKEDLVFNKEALALYRFCMNLNPKKVINTSDSSQSVLV